MFKNKFAIIITVLILFSIGIGLHFIGGEKNNRNNDMTIMPEDAALVIETKNFTSLLNQFNTKNQFRYVFSGMIEWRKFFKQSMLVDTILKLNPDIADILDNQKVTMAARVGINNKLKFIYSVPLENSDQKQLFFDVIKKYRDDNKSITKHKYEEKIFYNFNQHNPARRLFSFAFINGMFIISKEKSMIEETFRQIANPSKHIYQTGFMKLSKTAGDNSDMNVYVNYAYFPNMFKSVLATHKSSFYDFFKRIADWTELDMRYKNKSLFMSGFTYIDKNKKRYLKVLNSQKSLPNGFLSALPGNTSAFVALNISNPSAWAKNYDTYLQEIAEYMPVKQHLDSINKRFLPHIKKLIFKNIKGSVCIAWLDKSNATKQLEPIGLIELGNPDNFANILSSNKTMIDEEEVEFDGNPVYSILEPKLLKHLFGNVFNELASNYGIIYKNNLILAKNIDALKFYMRKITTIGSMQDNSKFKHFSKSLSSESNIYAYMNFELSLPLILKNLNKRKARMYRRNIDKFNSVYALAIQYGVSEHGVYTNFCTQINAHASQNSQNMWEVELDTVCNMKPAIVRNHASGNKEVLIQDKSNKLSFISAKGKVRWSKQLDSKILGKIHQVDKYKNGKIQYLFNTRNALHLLDRNGDNVAGFPVKFSSQATNACAVFDYDHNLKYRILIAFANKKVRLFDIGGKMVDGWHFDKTEGVVRMPAQHFIDEGKDYIIFADYNNTYILNRKGETRVEPKAKFNKNANATFFFEKQTDSNKSRFVAMGQDSYIYFIYLDGKVKRMHLSDFSEHTKFIYEDINGDGKKQFIVTDKNILYVFNRDKSLRFKIEFKHSLQNSLNVYKFGKSLYIGVSSVKEHKIYLVNTEGKIIKGFPILGAGEFSITKLNKKDNSNKMDILTGNDDKYLFNYRLKI